MSVTDWRQSIRSISLEGQVVALAVPVILDRISQLNQADRDDLFALVKELGGDIDVEDREGICKSIIEILDRRPGTIQQADLSSTSGQSTKWVKWTEWVGKRVREAREACELTQAGLSELTGLPQSHISRIESGKHSPSKITLEKLAKALNRPVSDFDFN
jgi:DNA-binding XRE family transcriptional regulator